MPPLVWLVTGATSGIGAAVANEIVSRGDRVIASGRNVEAKLGHLKSEHFSLLELDVSQPQHALRKAVRDAWSIYGYIDVLVNNAGLSGARVAEEADDLYMEQIINVNLLGPMRLTQSILPLFRQQGHGTVAFTSSSGAWGPLPFISHYAAAKAALSAWAEALHAELRDTGIRCISIEPGGFTTRLGQPRSMEEQKAMEQGPAIPAYLPLYQELFGLFATQSDKIMAGSLERCAMRFVDIIKGEGMAAGKDWVVRVPLGTDGMAFTVNKCEKQLRVAEAWREVSISTDTEGKTSEGFSLLSPFIV